MKRPATRTISASPWYRKRGGRRWFIFLVVLAVALLVLSRLDHPAVHAARAAVSDAVSPALSFLARPVDAAHRGWQWLTDLGEMYDQNQDLRREVETLRQWQDVALRLERENRRLRELLNAPASGARPVATPRVIGVTGGPFVRSVLVNAGARDGVERGMAVVDIGGIVGRVIQVGERTARILLITDLNSRIPVRIEGTETNAIAQGRNAEALDIAFVADEGRISVGDRVVTSGHGGVFPPGLPVGPVVRGSGDRLQIRPMALMERLDFVQILARPAAPEDSESTDAGDDSDSASGEPTGGR